MNKSGSVVECTWSVEYALRDVAQQLERVSQLSQVKSSPKATQAISQACFELWKLYWVEHDKNTALIKREIETIQIRHASE